MIDSQTSSSSSSVHTPSPTIHFSPFSYRARFLHGKTLEEYNAVIALYESQNKHFHVERLQECRTKAWFVLNNSNSKVVISAKSCHVRFCPLCGKNRRYEIQANTRLWLETTKFPKMLTLTLAHSDDSLKMQLERMYKAFKALRRLKLWKKSVPGLIWFLELKLSKENQWHPHFHILIDGKYIPQRKLKEAWQAETGDSYIVDIRPVKDKDKAAEYVAKYATKPMLISLVPEDKFDELLWAFKKRRLCGAAGTAKKNGALTKKKYNSADYTKLGSWSTIINNVGYLDSATQIYNAYITGSVISPDYSLKEMDDFIDNALFEQEVNKKTIVVDPTFY